MRHFSRSLLFCRYTVLFILFIRFLSHLISLKFSLILQQIKIHVTLAYLLIEFIFKSKRSKSTSRLRSQYPKSYQHQLKRVRLEWIHLSRLNYPLQQHCRL